MDVINEDEHLETKQESSHKRKTKSKSKNIDQEGMENLGREQVMAKKLYDAAVQGNHKVIKKHTSDEYLLRKTYVDNNIVHISVRYNNNSFAEEAVARFPDLMWESNLDGNTPIHIAAETGNTQFVKRFCDQLTDSKHLRKRNSTGNTPLHVALIYHNLEIASMLVNKDPYLAGIVNKSMEAPLHLVFQQYPAEPHLGGNEQIKERVRQLIEGKTTEWNKFKDFAPEEKMVVMISLLLEKKSKVACWRDASGLTPFHKAASLNKAYNLEVMNLIICHSPLSVEVCDMFGKTILHHLIHRIVYFREGLNFIRKPDILGLKNKQDQEGNTPLHMAVINKDFIMLQLLNNFSANQFIKNKEGLSAATLIEQSNILKMMKKGIMMEEETCRRAEYAEVSFLKAIVEKMGKHFLESHDTEGRNVLHKIFLIKWGRVVIPTEFLGFIEQILQEYRALLLETDNYGDTPIHILSRLAPDNIMIHVATGDPGDLTPPNNLYPTHKPDFFFYFFPPYTSYTYVWEYLGRTNFFVNLVDLCISNAIRPQLRQNSNGNTPLHEAIIAKNYQVLTKLAEFDREVASVNNRKETILHLLASLYPFPSMAKDVTDAIITNNTKDARHFLDEDGRSPLTRAIQASNIEFAERLCSLCPRLAELTDPNDQTFWHLLVNVPPTLYNFADSSFTKEVAWSQLEKKDKDGKTALHLAIECRRFDLAELFLGLHETLTLKGTPYFLEHLLKIPNSEGATPADLIGELSYVPPKFEGFIGKVSTMIGIRSIWGIPSTQIKDYVSTIGVIAALLTTITFTAAFTVPGGLNQEKGTPLLIKDASFQVFMISDIVAMCLSMMVLFCLLWIMATGNTSKSVVLLDFSIILLLASFYTTLVTFMTGLYATTYLVKPWIAIVALVLCSMLLLLMHQYLVMKFILPSGKAVLIFVNKTFQCAKRWGKSLIPHMKNCCCPKSSSMSQLPVSSISSVP